MKKKKGREQSASLPKPKAQARQHSRSGSSRIGVSDAAVSVSPAWLKLQALEAGEPLQPAKPATRYGVPVREDGCTCARPERTGHVPGCKHFADALYLCEKGDKPSIFAMAKMGGLTVADLERKRLDFTGPPASCSDECWPDRRRCWRCPFWKRHEEEHPL